MKLLSLIVMASHNGRDAWFPVEPDKLPAWLTEPEVMGKLANGEEAMNCAEGLTGSLWYRAVAPENFAAALLLGNTAKLQ